MTPWTHLLRALLIAVVLTSAPALAGTRRFAIVIGHNTGGPQRLPLRYAESDAGKMARVLTELGEVEPADVYLLQGRRVRDVELVADRVRQAVAQTHASLDRAVVYFYFSGHGDDEALELGRERLGHTQLRTLLKSTGADLRVAFIDACRSGAAVQEKGARLAAPFQVALVDELRTRGDAIITSSARDELSLESSDVAGGFFTNHLVTGLRGAADVSGDGRVTLAEAYRYAHDRTVTTTAASTGVAQHPNYEMSLSGQGELVLVELRRASARVQLPDGVERALFREVLSDQLIAEWIDGASRAVAVPAGTYLITVVAGGRSLGGRVRVEEGEARTLDLGELREVEPLAVRARGDAPLSTPTEPLASGRGSDRVEVALMGSWGYGFGGEVRVGLEQRSGHGITAALQLGTARYQMMYAAASPALVATFSLQARGGYRWLWEFGRFGAWAGVEAALGATLHTGMPYAPQGRELRPVVGIGPRIGAFYDVTPHLRFGVFGEGLIAAYIPTAAIGFHVTWTH